MVVEKSKTVPRVSSTKLDEKPHAFDFFNDKLVAVVGIFVVAEFSGSDITIALENEF